MNMKNLMIWLRCTTYVRIKISWIPRVLFRSNRVSWCSCTLEQCGLFRIESLSDAILVDGWLPPPTFGTLIRLHFKNNYRRFSGPWACRREHSEPLSLCRLFACEEAGVKKGGGGFFIPFDRLRDQVSALCIEDLFCENFLLNNSASSLCCVSTC